MAQVLDSPQIWNNNIVFKRTPIVIWDQLNKTFTSVVTVLESENNSYACRLHL